MLSIERRRGIAFVAAFLEKEPRAAREAPLGGIHEPAALEVLSQALQRLNGRKTRSTLHLAVALTRLPGVVEFLLPEAEVGSRDAVEALRAIPSPATSADSWSRHARSDDVRMPRSLYALFFAAGILAQTARDLAVEPVTPPLPDQRERWAVIIGVSTYKYAPPHAQLRFAHRDAAEFARLLRSGEGGGLPADHVRLLTEQAATTGAIRAALHGWLPRTAKSNDIVYVFFAGHAVEGERGEAFLVAHDSDPQNLHATAISFREVNGALTRTPATIVFLADACHAGGIGWASDPGAIPAAAPRSLEQLGAKERSVLKLLASRANERSFEDERWGGGHGVFTYSVLTALRGAAERDRDGFIRASELIEYVSRAVPQQTGQKQNPRIAGNFDAALPLAAAPAAIRHEATAAAILRVLGPPRAAVYIDHRFGGHIRPSGDLLIETTAGAHALSVDIEGEEPFDHPLRIAPGPNTADLRQSSGFVLAQLRSAIRSGAVLGPGGALEQYRARQTADPAATALIMAALEDTGMACVSDYVQSTSNALKRPMFLRAAEAFMALAQLRPGDLSPRAKALFCQARAHIAANEFSLAVDALERSLAMEPEFACSHNALGVALSRLGRPQEARSAFEAAARLAPAWALPPLQIAQQRIAAGDLKGAVPHLESAAERNPRSSAIAWTLARVHRLLGNNKEFLRAAEATIAIDRDYAPIYAELGQFYESSGDRARAMQSYSSYLLLAPNFSDSTEVRKRLEALRPVAPATSTRPPSLRREGERK